MFKGQLETLSDENFAAKKQAEDAALRQWIAADPKRRATYGDPWAALEKALRRGEELRERCSMIEDGRGFCRGLFGDPTPTKRLARKIDPEARSLRKAYEDEVGAPSMKALEAIARARFERDGTTSYPEATFTLRLSYGKVAGWPEKGTPVEPFTDLDGLYRRATGADPFKLPDSWLKAKPLLNLAAPMNFVTDNDTIGGNSGSAVIDREGRAVGLSFDGNIHSLGGAFTFDGSVNRAVAVHTAAIVEAVRKVYRLPKLADELVSGHR